MKLYEIPRNSKIKVIKTGGVPPQSREAIVGEILTFGQIDGMYSWCKDVNGELIHLAAWTDVEIVE